MKRSKRGVTLLAVGMALAMVSLAGVFAAVVDSANTGALSINSAAIAPADINLKVSDEVYPAATTSQNCQQAGTAPNQTNPVGATYVDDSTTAVFAMTNSTPNHFFEADVCLANFGTEDAVITAEIVEATDVELGACSSTETSAGDTSCADGAAGELSGNVVVGIDPLGTTNGSSGDGCGSTGDPWVEGEAPRVAQNGNPATPVVGVGGNATDGPNDVLAGGDAACVQLRLTYEASTTSAEALLGQTDQVSVKVRFNGEAVS